MQRSFLSHSASTDPVATEIRDRGFGMEEYLHL